MIIRKFAFGNETEAFVESRFSPYVNIIFTGSNNKGKTLVSQGIMYTLGNIPAFPDSIDPDNYYFFLEVEVNEHIYKILRHKGSYAVARKDHLNLFESTTELKYFLKKELIELPQIEKNGELRVVDPHLFYELFFIGQDKKQVSEIVSKGFYKNEDFFNMLYAMKGITKSSISSEELEKLKLKKAIARRRLAILKRDQNGTGAESNTYSWVLASQSETELRNKEEKLKNLHEKLSVLKKQRNRETNRKLKLETLINELRSLNLLIETGSVACGSCGSNNIIFRNKDIDFEISNNTVKSSILNAIQERIEIKKDNITFLNHKITEGQNALSSEIENIPNSYRDLILYKDEINKAKLLEPEITELKEAIEEIEEALKTGKIITENELKDQKNAIGNILDLMNHFSFEIDSEDGGATYENLFSKPGKVISGSEAQLFYLSKLFSFKQYLNHTFPIVVDDFRDKEISTIKEKNIISIAEKIGGQFIFTATLKEEEYHADKYVLSDTLNPIDYSHHKSKKILNAEHVTSFKGLIDYMAVKLDGYYRPPQKLT